MIHLSVEPPTRSYAPSRRGFLRAMLGGIGAWGGMELLGNAAHAATAADPNTAVIQIWLAGGPSHVDLYDPKPEAPVEYRSLFPFVPTDVPGLDVCELLPRHAGIMRHLSLIRSLHHTTNDHVAGTHWMQTGEFGATAAQPDPVRPSVGSIVAQSRSATGASQLPYVHVLPELPIELYSQQFGSSYLGPAFDPFDVTMPFPGYSRKVRFDVPHLVPVPGLELERIDRRLSLREQFDRMRRGFDEDGWDAGDYGRAFELVSSRPIQEAFDLSRESAEVRGRYGNTGWGQGALLCRRLVEAGATFVTLNTDSSSNMWDNHANIEKYFKIMLPAYDRMLSALVGDLVERGLYERVIVLVWGEFGRTPQINQRGGRDHWGRAACALVGGGGLRVGQVIGATTAKGEEPAERPIRPGDVLATLYQRLGIDTQRQFVNRSGRPIPILSDGEPIEELVG